MHRYFKITGMAFFLIIPLIFCLLSSVFCPFCRAEETLTITTYYPSPSGSYNELGVNKLAVDINGVAVPSEYDAMNNGDAHIGRSLIVGAGGGSGFAYDELIGPPDNRPGDGSVLIKGSVGIGTTVPGAKLHIAGADNTAPLLISKPGADGSGTIYTGIEFGYSSGISKIARIMAAEIDRGGGNLEFQTPTGGTTNPYSTKLFVARDGNVGIGTTSPGTLLHLKKNGGGGPTLGFTDDNSDTITGQIANTNDGANSRDLIFSTWQNVVGLSEKLRIAGNGSVGIGRTYPGARLNIYSNNSGDILRLEHSTNGQDNNIGINFTFGGTTRARIETYQPQPSPYCDLNFYTTSSDGSNNRMTIKNYGDVYLNTGDLRFGAGGPGQITRSIYVAPEVGSRDGDHLSIAAGNGGPWGGSVGGDLYLAGGVGQGGLFRGAVYIQQNGGSIGIGSAATLSNVYIYGTGKGYQPGGGSWGVSSDKRLKKNIKPITGALEKITQLQGVNFEWINPKEHGERGGIEGGFIGQDVEKIFPNWVSAMEPSGKDKELVGEGEKIKTLALPLEFDALLIESIKEQQKQIEKQQKDIDQLKEEIRHLKNK